MRREDTQNSKDKVVQLLDSQSQGCRHGEVFRRDQICNHVPAAPAPLAPTLAQIPAPVARLSPQRCCCGNSMAMSICQTASCGRAALARGAPGPPGARRRRRAAGAPAGPALPARRGRLRRATDLWREISRGKMASPEPEESWSNHIHTHTPARTHTRTHSHTGARRARLILAGAKKKKKKNVYMYIYPRLSDLCYFFFLFFKGWIGALKNVAGFGLAGGGARRARALLLSCAVRSAAPGGPARPLVRPRSLVLPPPPPPPLHGRARPAPPPRPLAARPRPRRALEWGRARVPASRALSRVPES